MKADPRLLEWRIAMTAVTWSLASVVASAQVPSDFAMRQPLVASGDKAFFRIELPDAVYDGAARADLGDLRVFNGHGALVPFAFMPRPSPLVEGIGRRPLALFPVSVDTTRSEAGDFSIRLRKDSAGTMVDIRTRDGTPVAGSTTVGYLIDVSQTEEPLIALRLPLPGSGSVTARLRLDASDDLDHWRTVVADAPLLALEYNGNRLARDRVEFPPMRARYLRITWLTAAPPALTVALGDLGDRLVDPPRRVRRATGVPDASLPDAFTFDLGGALPVDRVSLELPDVNTVAPIRVEARTTPEDPWRAAGEGVAYRLRQDGGEVGSPAIAVAATPSRYFRVRIDPKSGGVGATPPRLAAGWYPQEIVYAARGAGPFELAYGSRRVLPGALPIATLVPGYAARKPLPENVGVAQAAAGPSVVNRRAMREPLDLRRWLLWGSLVLAALLLGYMALRLAQRMK